ALDELRRGAADDAVGVEVGLASELVDPLGEEVEMLGLFLGVLGKFLLDGLAGQPRRADRVKLVAQYAHDLGGDRVVEERDRVLDLASVVLRDRAVAQLLPRALPNSLDVRNELSRCAHRSLLVGDIMPPWRHRDAPSCLDPRPDRTRSPSRSPASRRPP